MKTITSFLKNYSNVKTIGLSLSLVFILAFSTFAQTPQYKYEVTDNPNSRPSLSPIPFFDGSENRTVEFHSQWLYFPEEFGRSVPSGREIEAIYFKAGKPVPVEYLEFTVSLKQDSRITTLDPRSWETGLSVIKEERSVRADLRPNEWFRIELDSIFIYDPLLPLIVDVEFKDCRGGMLMESGGIPMDRNNAQAITHIHGEFASSAPSSGATDTYSFGFDLKSGSPSASLDAGVVDLITNTNCAGPIVPGIVVKNFGTTTIDSVNIVWDIMGGIILDSTTYRGTISPGDSVTVNLSSMNFAANTFYDISLYTSLVNGQVDLNHSNDTLNLNNYRTGLDGNYTINQNVPKTGTNFVSFEDLTTSLQNFGICGPVVVDVIVSSGPYNERIAFGDIPGSSPTNTVRINGNGNTVEYNSTSTSEMPILTFNGAKYIAVDHLTFKTLNTTYGWGALFTNDAQYDSITNCHFDLTSITGSSSVNSNGIVFSGSNTSATTIGDNGSNCYIANNHIEGRVASGGPYYAVTLYGTSSTVSGSNNNIFINNKIENFYYYGMRSYYASGTKFIGNEVTRSGKTSTTIFYGIYAGYGSDIEIVGNKIHSPIGTGTGTSSAYGIHVLSTPNILIANNLVYNMNQGGVVRGIYLSSAADGKVYHNTIDIAVALNNTSADYGIYTLGTSTGLDIKNNIVSITGGGTGTKYGFYYSTVASIGDAQMNNIYVNSSQGGTQYYGYYTTAYSTQADFNLAYPNLEVGSPTLDPQYTHIPTGNLLPMDAALYTLGEDLTSTVPVDINGKSRSITPTIGAFEGDPLHNDATVLSVDSPAFLCLGNKNVVATIGNVGSNQITSLLVFWEVDGIQQTPLYYTQLLDTLGGAGNTTDQVVLGSYNFQGATDLKVWTALPNGVVDPVNSNDTISITLTPSLSGSYTVNNNQSTSGTNYKSFEDLALDLNAYGVCGPVVVDVVANTGPYNEVLEFGDIHGTNSTNTIRINGNGNTVEFMNTSTQRQLLVLDGTKYLTIDSLNFKALSATYGWAALITGGAAYDSIINCEFDLSGITTTASASSSGIAFSGSNTNAITAGDNGSNCYIGNNHLIGNTAAGSMYYSVTLVGESENNTIENNTIENYYMYGVYINGAANNKIINNEMHRATKTSVTTFYGIYATGSTPGTQIIGNKIHSPGGVNSGTGTASMIHLLGQGTVQEPIIVTNNLIYNINQGGIARGVYLSTPVHIKLYHNTIDFSEKITSASATYGIYVTGNADEFYSKNNIVSITEGTTGLKYGFYYTSINSITDAQMNNYYVNSAQSGTQNYGYLGGARATQAAFQTAYPNLEVNSPAVDPQYTSISTGDFTPGNSDVIGVGENVFADVPMDINNMSRIVPSTLGAFETIPTASNDASVMSFVNPNGLYCSGSQLVSVIIGNAGTNAIDSLEVHWTLNGLSQPTVYYKNTLDAITSSNGQHTAEVVLGSVIFSSSSADEIVAWTALPNGVADTSNLNDTLSASFMATDFVASINSDTICLGSSVRMSLSPIIGYKPGQITWQSSTDSMNWVDIPNTDVARYNAEMVMEETWYRANIGGITGCYSNVEKINLIDVNIVEVNNGSVCDSGTAELSAFPSDSGLYVYWYDDLFSDIAIDSGNTFTTPVITSTETFYVSATEIQGGAKEDSLEVPDGGATGVYPQMITVQVKKDMVIRSLGVMTNNTNGGSWDVYYRPDDYTKVSGGNTSSAGWTQVSSITTTSSLGPNAYTEIASGLNISAFAGDTLSFYIFPTGPTFRYHSSSQGTVVGSNDDLAVMAGNRGSTLWNATSSGGAPPIQITYGDDGCQSPRYPVVAAVYSSTSPLEVDLGEDQSFCEGSSITLDAQNPGSTFLWNTGDTTQTLQVDSAGQYIVTVTRCSSSSSDTINITEDRLPISGVSISPLASTYEWVAMGATDVDNYYWDFGDGMSSSDSATTHDYLQNGSYIASLTLSNSCGVDNKLLYVTKDEACAGSTYSWAGHSITSAGVYIDTLINASNQDSVVVLFLDYAPMPTQNLSVSICQGSSYQLGSQNLTASGIYVDTLSSVQGCDTIYNLILNVVPAVTHNFTASICQGDSFLFAGQNLMSTGIYVDSLSAVNGCDSIVTLLLNVIPITYTNLSESICQGDSFTFAGQSLAHAGVYADTLQTVNGCDSIISLLLSVEDALDKEITAVGDTLFAVETGATYQWLMCDSSNNTFTVLNGETNPYYVTSDSNYYAVAITKGSCVDTSSCVSISDIAVGISQQELTNRTFRIFPNPTSEYVMIQAEMQGKHAKIEVRSINGQLVSIVETTNIDGMLNERVDVSSYSKGIYLIHIKTDKQQFVEKIIVQ